MSLAIRVMTGLWVGALVWLAFNPATWLRVWLFGLAAAGVAYVGLASAAYLERVDCAACGATDLVERAALGDTE